MYASSGNKHFFTKSCHRQTYQNYEQPPQTSQNSDFQSHFSVLKIGRIVPIFFSLKALFIILVGLTVTLFSEKRLISTRCIHGFISNLIKKPWTVSIKDWGEEKIAWKVVLSFTWKWISTLCRPSTMLNNWNICLTWHLLIHEKIIWLSNFPNQGTRKHFCQYYIITLNQKLLTKVNLKSTIRYVPDIFF